MGRKKISDEWIAVTVRLTPEDAKPFQELAELYGKSISAIIRDFLIEEKAKTTELVRIVREQIEIAKARADALAPEITEAEIELFRASLLMSDFMSHEDARGGEQVNRGNDGLNPFATSIELVRRVFSDMARKDGKPEGEIDKAFEAVLAMERKRIAELDAAGQDRLVRALLTKMGASARDIAKTAPLNTDRLDHFAKAMDEVFAQLPNEPDERAKS